MPNNQQQHRTLHIWKDVPPYALARCRQAGALRRDADRGGGGARPSLYLFLIVPTDLVSPDGFRFAPICTANPGCRLGWHREPTANRTLVPGLTKSDSNLHGNRPGSPPGLTNVRFRFAPRTQNINFGVSENPSEVRFPVLSRQEVEAGNGGLLDVFRTC